MVATPKYSFVLPTLNGSKTLRETLPVMLAIDRDDIEWVISNNCSDDDTEDVVRSFDDKRIRLIKSPRRLAISPHLEFAYLHARGEWQTHMGDDDVLFPSRFALFDRIQSMSDAKLIRGELVRYYYPDYHGKMANQLSSQYMTGLAFEIKGETLFEHQINTAVILGGGSWAVHRDIVNSVRDKMGFFVSPRHVEFFAMRAAAAMSEKVVLLDTPVWCLGRHGASTGTQALYPKKEATANDWDWKLEYPKPWSHCPFAYHGYTAISMDAALLAMMHFRGTLERFDWIGWVDRSGLDLMSMARIGRLPKGVNDIWNEGLDKLPRTIKAVYVCRNANPVSPESEWKKRHGDIPMPSPLDVAPLPPTQAILDKTVAAVFGWHKPKDARELGIHTIGDVPKRIEYLFPEFFEPDTLDMRKS
jgi:glycosyltransferase involved in cell wall biosynthesis